MSVDGQLIVSNGSTPGAHQIYTQDGQITISADHDSIRFEQNPEPVARRGMTAPPFRRDPPPSPSRAIPPKAS